MAIHSKAAKQLLFVLAVIRLLLPFVLQHPSYQPHRDEFLYLDYAYHMDWGYMEVPPLLSVFSWILSHLSHSIFWVKFFPALFGAFTFLLCGKIVLHLGGNRISLWLLFIAFTFSGFLRLFHLFQPGFLEVFSWTLIGYCMIRYVQTNQPRWLLYFGMACGIGLMSKYTTAFYIAGLTAALLVTKHRGLLMQRYFWIAALLAFTIFLPNMWWQNMHRFPVVHHMQELRQTQLVHVSASDFIIDQLINCFPVIPIWLAGLYFAAITSAGKAYRWIAWQYLIVIILLIIGSGKGYYAMGLYSLLFAFGSAHMGKWMERRQGLARWWPLMAMAIPCALIIPFALPTFAPVQQVRFYEATGMNKTPLFKWEDQQMHPLPQDFADMIGWKEMAAMAAKQFHALPDSVQRNTMLYCRGYFTAGALNFYRKDLHLPEAMSDNGSYLLWMPENYHFKNLMMIGHRMPDADDEVFNHFSSRAILDSMQMPLFRENGIKVFLFRNADTALNNLVEKKIAEMKGEYLRK